MKLFNVVVKYLIVIALGVLVFYLDDLEFLDSIYAKIILLSICLGKSAYFVYISFKKILETNEKNIPYHNFLLFMAVNVSLIVISFGIDNYCLFQIEPNSYAGINSNFTNFETAFEFVFYSLLSFTNFGFNDITPESLTSKTLLMLEITLSFVSIIFILSDFISLKESISTKVKSKG